MSPLTPYLVGGALLATVAAGAGGFFGGRHVGKLESDATHAAADAADAREQAKRLATAQQQDDRAAAVEGVRTNTVREITREVPKIIAGSPVYRNVCIDAGGVRALARAVEAANGRSAPGGGPAGDSADVRGAAGDGGSRDGPVGAGR